MPYARLTERQGNPVSDTAQQDLEMKRVGATIKALRDAHGLSREQLATAVGKSTQLIGFIENGKRRATPEVCRKVADTLGVPLAAITVRNFKDIQDKERVA
jgi:transcriptional regulator with XRE-family HTH domain